MNALRTSYAGIDVGARNIAVCVVSRLTNIKKGDDPDLKIEHWSCTDLIASCHDSYYNVMNNVHYCQSFIQKYMVHLDGCASVMLEKQMTPCFQEVAAIIRYHYYTTSCFVDPRTYKQGTGNYAKNKQLSIDTVATLLTEEFAEQPDKHIVFRLSCKKDDLADSLLLARWGAQQRVDVQAKYNPTTITHSVFPVFNICRTSGWKRRSGGPAGGQPRPRRSRRQKMRTSTAAGAP
jgi:hypothetical protein